MINFKKVNVKKYELYNNDIKITDIELLSSTVTNKYYIVTNFIEKMSERSVEFTDWFSDFMTKFVGSEYHDKFNLVKDNTDNMKLYVDEYIDGLEVDFSKFVDESKSKKSTILFYKEEIEKIIRLSGYLKLYSIISNSENLKFDQKAHKDIYNTLSYEIIENQIIYKIYNVIKTKTYRYNLTDKYMWEYIKSVQCKDMDVHVVEIFNFIMNSILIICEEDRNPITYFLGVAEESIKWLLRSAYKSTVIYSDTISTEDIQSSNIDNLKTYSYNDTLGNLKGIAYKQLYQLFEDSNILIFEDEKDKDAMRDSDNRIVEVQNRIMSINHISPLCECIVFPLLSKLTSIPYNHFKTLSPEQSAVLSLYVQGLMRKVFKNDYKNLVNLLGYYPDNQAALVTTYKLKTMSEFVNLSQDVNNFFGFKTKIILGQMLSYFVGRVSRMTFFNMVDGKSLGGIPLSKVEQETIQLFISWFSNKLEPEFAKMKEILEEDFL